MKAVAICLVVALGVVGSDLPLDAKAFALGSISIMLLGCAIDAIAQRLGRWS